MRVAEYGWFDLLWLIASVLIRSGNPDQGIGSAGSSVARFAATWRPVGRSSLRSRARVVGKRLLD